MGFEIDEYLVGKFFKHLKRRKKTNPEIESRTVKLLDIKSRLTIMARALTGNPIEIFPAEREGGYKNNNFFLPVSFAEFATVDENLTFYHFRILYLCIQQRLDYNWKKEENDPTLILSQQKALEASEAILTVLFQEFSLDKQFLEHAKNHFTQKAASKLSPDFSWLFGKWMKNDLETHNENILQNFSDKIKKPNEIQPLTTLKAQAVEQVSTLELDKKQQED